MLCKKIDIFHVFILVLLESDCLGNSDAMRYQRSTLFTQSDDDSRSLEVCTARNQQRLGSVFGNITRHHKKGHRRKPTTLPTTVTATYDDTTIYISSTEYPTESKLPTPQRLYAFTDYETVAIEHEKQIEIDNIKEFVEIERHKKHKERHGDKEVVPDMKQISNRHRKVKKMYRDSTASNVNKLPKASKNSIFLTENCTSVIAQIGTTAVLHCEVSDITENTVTWIRRKDYSLLSVGLVTYSADNRFFSAHGRHVKDWALHIKFATSADAGFYECQVPTHPPTSIFFKLVLVAAYAEIIGESEKIIHEGSMLRLVCVVRRSTEPPTYVFWYFENRMINYDLNGVTVHNGRQTSELVIGKAEPRHAGNYTCVPANAKAASVTVHVVQSETPAAMQHGNNVAETKRVELVIIVLLFCVACLGHL